MANASYEEIFGSYRLASHEPLIGLKRSKCKKCRQSRMYFCYKCHTYIDSVDEAKMPKMKLPWKIDIIKHAKEVDGKSTAIHAALLAPDDVKIYTYPTIPSYKKDDRILMVFPDKKASPIEDIFGPGSVTLGTKRQCSDNDICTETGTKRAKTENGAPESSRNEENVAEATTQPESKLLQFTKIVFIDCTWNQAYGISSDERIKHIPTVKLSDLNTVYWRHNEEMPFTFLATIEAIYSFLKISHELAYGSYDGRYDNMLYFYSYFYKLVQKGLQNSKKNQSKSQVKD